MQMKKEDITIWVTVEAVEVIELKRIVLDRDAAGAVNFFRTVIAPQVNAAAKRFGIKGGDMEGTDDRRLPG